MNLKTFIPGIGLLLATHLSMGQVTRDEFTRSLDYLTCQLSLYSLEKEPALATNAAIFKSRCPCELTRLAEVIEVLTPMKVGNTLRMVKEIQAVTNTEFQRFEKKPVESILDYLTDGIFRETYLDRNSGQKRPKYQSLAEFRRKKLSGAELAEIRGHLEELLVTGSAPADNLGPVIGELENKPDSTTVSDGYPAGKKYDDDSQNQPPVFWSEKFLPVLSLIFGVVIGSLSTVFFLKRKKRKTSTRSVFPGENTIKYRPFFSPVEATIRLKLERLKKELAAKDVTIAELRALIDIRDRSIPPDVISSIPVVTVQETSSSERYFSIPDIDERLRGFWFNDNGADNYRPYVSTYRLRVSHDQQSAQFEVVNASEAMTKLIGSRVSGVLPVCQELNAYQPEAQRISTQKPGKAQREGDRWVVSEPAQIKYS